MIIMGLVNPYLFKLEQTILGGIINLCFVGVICLLIAVKKQGIETIGLKKGIWYFFTVGLCEEVIFRGYILTGLYGIVKNVYIDVLLSGVLFVLMHFPFRMVAYHISFWELITNIPYIADLFLTSLILSFIRVKSDSLYGAVIPHWISDLSYAIVTHI